MFPYLFLNTQLVDQNEVLKNVQLLMTLNPTAYALFIVGQFLFIVYFVRIVMIEHPP